MMAYFIFVKFITKIVVAVVAYFNNRFYDRFLLGVLIVFVILESDSLRFFKNRKE